jgi:penicillin amidase
MYLTNISSHRWSNIMQIWIKRLVFALIGLLSVALALSYVLLRASLPDYNAVLPANVQAEVKLSRDAQGYVSIVAKNREDAAFALGFAHGQERFFQMDLLRKNAAGELASLFGARALPFDEKRRIHRFRDRAELVLKQSHKAELTLLQHYTAGVNHAMQQWLVPPFEYILLQHKPEAWRETDSILAIYSMYLDLQSSQGMDELSHGWLKQQLPADWYRFLTQHNSDWQAALDGSEMAKVTVPTTPYPDLLKQQRTSCRDCSISDGPYLGSNNFAVSGAITPHGSAIVADDMHLGLRVPATWFKVKMQWQEQQFVAGVSLPGNPAVVAGSNGHIAWGFTNSTADWTDVVALERSDDGRQYATPAGMQDFKYNNEVIKVKGQADKVILIEETQWGPVLPAPFKNYALRWVAHDVEGLNLHLLRMENAKSSKEALTLASKVGIPTQNLLVADQQGHIGWTLIGALPKRQLQDMDTPQSWHDGQNEWLGYLDGTDYPRIENPKDNRLWTANARMIGGASLALIGDGGYDLGARGWQIKQALFDKPQHDEQSLHAIQLDHRALFLQRWHGVLLSVLTDEFVNQHQLQDYRRWVTPVLTTAAADQQNYLWVRQFRRQVLQLLFAPLSAALDAQSLDLSDLKFNTETPGWLLLQARRADTLPAAFSSWDALLQQAVLDSITEQQRLAKPLADQRYGDLNLVQLQHPLSQALPWLSPLLDMPAQSMHGDSHMPRIQLPDHGQSQRMVVAPGHEDKGILVIPAGQSGHPLSPFYRADHEFWFGEQPLGFLPQAEKYQQQLYPTP